MQILRSDPLRSARGTRERPWPRSTTAATPRGDDNQVRVSLQARAAEETGEQRRRRCHLGPIHARYLGRMACLLTPGEQGAYHGSAMPDFALSKTRESWGSPGRALCVEHFPAALGDGRQATASPARRRAIANRHMQPTRLAQIEWFEALPNSPIYLVETQKRNGNVRLSELGVLAQAAAAVLPAARSSRSAPSTGARH